MYMDLDWIICQLLLKANLSIPNEREKEAVWRNLDKLSTLTDPTRSQTSPTMRQMSIEEGILDPNPTKSYHPKHIPLEQWNAMRVPIKLKYPFPDTGLEEILLNYAVIQKIVTESRLPDEKIVTAALKAEKNQGLGMYDEHAETRYYLPKEIKDLPETERASATLKLLQQIKSSNEFLKDLSPLPEQS